MSLEGILNINKPQGLTSHDVVNRIRRLSGIRRVGHAGTLDPLATGVLLVCVGRATRLSEYLIGQPKSYIATVRLGQATDTYDAEGEVITELPVQVSKADIDLALPRFIGHIKQKAPAFSAIKRHGQPLYKLARRGEEFEPPVRDVHIYHLQLLKWDDPFILLDLTCSSGTYVRSLAHDLGQQLGCGGHISALKRTSVGDFSLDSSVTLNELESDEWTQHLLPSDLAVKHLPRIELSYEEAQQVQVGKIVTRRDDHPQTPLVRVYEPGGQFLAIMRTRENSWQPHKVFLPDP